MQGKAYVWMIKQQGSGKIYAVAPCIYSAHCVESVLINYLREIVLNDSWCLRNWLCGIEGVKTFPNHQAERLWIWLNLVISVALLILIPCTYLKWRKELNKASKNFFHHDISTDNTSIHPLDENYVVVRLWPRSAGVFGVNASWVPLQVACYLWGRLFDFWGGGGRGVGWFGLDKNFFSQTSGDRNFFPNIQPFFSI